METYILAVDIGTTSTKGLAIHTNGHVVTQRQVEYGTNFTNEGFAEQDPTAIVEAVTGVIADVVRHMKSPPVGVTFSCAMHGIMAIDQNDRPLTPLMTWADTRSTEQSTALRQSKAGALIYHNTGTPIHPMSPLCKLLWLKERQSDLFRSASRFVSAKEFIFGTWFGDYVVDYSIASASGLFDVHNLEWSKAALGALELSSTRLSRPVSPYYILRGLLHGRAQLLGLPKDVPFIAGANDGCLAHLGCGAMNPGDLSVTIGTSGAVRMASRTFADDSRSRIFNYRLDEETFITGGATNNGAVLLSWFDESILGREPDGAAFVEEAMSVESSDGLLCLPLLLGERAPMYDPLARGVFLGVGIRHKRAHFRRAILEGICFELKAIAQAVEQSVTPIKRVIASGGFVRSDAWVQLLADILGKPVTVNSQSDASSLGAALQGYRALGVPVEFRDESGKTFTPDGSRGERYNKVFSVMEPLYDKLKDDFHKLQSIG